MATLGIYEYTFGENDQTRTVEDGTVLPMYTLTITNTEENKTVRLNNIARVIEREDWIEISYNAAIDTLEGTPNCCLDGQVEWVTE